MNQEETLFKVIHELKDLKLQLTNDCPELRREWLPKHEVMRYLDYKPTQMISFIREHGIINVKFGKRQLLSTKQLLLLFQSLSHQDAQSSDEAQGFEKKAELKGFLNKGG